ncbi:hypothetical protein FGB62_62g233 [Gracilaria domingensis]|nr:hypothetical protein FGB62_62g233 [Gracilaria domingensis]
MSEERHVHIQERARDTSSSSSSSDTRSLKSVDSRVSAPPNNQADETAFLNIITVHGERLEYTDHVHEAAFKKNDNRGENEPFLRRWLLSVVRGRAMPVIPLLVSTGWAALAVVITWLSRKNYEAHVKGECRWWCTPLAVDGDALSVSGARMFTTGGRSEVKDANGCCSTPPLLLLLIELTSFAKYVVQAFPSGTFHRGDQERMLGFLVAFPVALKRQLRGEKDLRELKGVLSSEDLAELQNAPSMPSHCLYVLSAYLLAAQRRERRLPQAFLVVSFSGLLYCTYRWFYINAFRNPAISFASAAPR